MQIKDKVIAITGGGRGLGRAIAVAFAAKGAHVALMDLNQADLDATRALVEAHGVTARSYLTNVTNEENVIAALDAVVSDFGRLDVMVNNAGITKDGLLVKAKDGVVTGKMSMDQWNAVIGVNLTGVFLCGREAAERMIKLGNGGVIINISSISRYGNMGQTNYTATKAGVAAMSEVWGKELARYGIRTGAIAPGYCATDILAAMKPEVLEKVIQPVPLKRLGDPSEIAHAAVFIAENDFYTGRTIDVDGGLRL
ncbi:MAG: SDR family oxidoreductase [Steroidobacteraceae bacterium]|nr:SDR family oxidoreductase [Steroidobacteraceae bacterium]MCC7197900.1 SDR family oxidoreductase [Gammaproteobacteria bacterium]